MSFPLFFIKGDEEEGEDDDGNDDDVGATTTIAKRSSSLSPLSQRLLISSAFELLRSNGESLTESDLSPIHVLYLSIAIVFLSSRIGLFGDVVRLFRMRSITSSSIFPRNFLVWATSAWCCFCFSSLGLGLVLGLGLGLVLGLGLPQFDGI